MMFQKGEKIINNYFTGSVWLNVLLTEDETRNYSISSVSFDAGSRNNWHIHPAGQILLISEGSGFYQEKGDKARVIRKGDVVVIPSMVEHWHGASKLSNMSHIVITNSSSEGAVEWLAPVTEEEYLNCHGNDFLDSVELNLTEAAIKNHEELFPNHVSTLKTTDPEFIELFDNFAFDEVISNGGLDVRTRLMLILASTIACQAVNEYKIMMRAALTVGVTPVEIKEILYQTVPYVGIAKTFDFLHATNEVLEQNGIALPLEGQSTTNRESRFDTGLAIQKKLFGGMIDDLYANSPEDLIHFQKYLSSNCFGDYYSRRGLDLKMRELLTFTILISLGGVEPQVKAHVKGNLDIGNDRAVLISAVTQLLPYIGYPRALNAINCINDVTKIKTKDL